ncbi:hypothetical protein CHT98_20960 (plasmid) [Azospirillum brasilense]|uniref:Transposase n=1 Tax=Azospirillum brasilense TaxID=192 RepID=A0A235H9D0_AZOBR|nr:hypothetical protein CHT98_20960 [Azospirillum brasilense]
MRGEGNGNSAAEVEDGLTSLAGGQPCPFALDAVMGLRGADLIAFGPGADQNHVDRRHVASAVALAAASEAQARATWRDLPEDVMKWRTAWRRLQRRAAAGIWGRIVAELRAMAADAGWDAHLLDSSVIRAHAHADEARRASARRAPATEPSVLPFWTRRPVAMAGRRFCLGQGQPTTEGERPWARSSTPAAAALSRRRPKAAAATFAAPRPRATTKPRRRNRSAPSRPSPTRPPTGRPSPRSRVAAATPMPTPASAHPPAPSAAASRALTTTTANGTLTPPGHVWRRSRPGRAGPSRRSPCRPSATCGFADRRPSPLSRAEPARRNGSRWHVSNGGQRTCAWRIRKTL